MSGNQIDARTNRNLENIPRTVMNCALVSLKLNICHANIQSLCARQLSKLNEFKMCFLDSKLDIICVTETWLTENVSHDLISVDGYNLVRSDRNYSRGGGICVYLKKDLKSKFCRVPSIIKGYNIQT